MEASSTRSPLARRLRSVRGGCDLKGGGRLLQCLGQNLAQWRGHLKGLGREYRYAPDLRGGVRDVLDDWNVAVAEALRARSPRGDLSAFSGWAANAWKDIATSAVPCAPNHEMRQQAFDVTEAPACFRLERTKR